MLEIGIGKADITAFKRGVGMLGYGLAIQVMLDIETPLYSRAFVFYDPIKKNRVTFVNTELCMINPSLKDGVVRKLEQNYPQYQYSHENLMLTAQHTHTGPSGFSLHPLYSMSSPGFVQEIYDKIVNGIVESIVQAEENKAPGKVQVGKGDFDLETSISYNRSIAAYNLNPEVEQKISFANRHMAADKRMTLLQITDEIGKPRASVNWFAVHTTNLPNDWMKVCSDNKGFAATELEESFSEDPNYVSAFAQGACGDVSARVKYNPKLARQRGYWEGDFEDDLKSSKYNGNIQYKKAKEIISNIDTSKDLGATGVDAQLLYTDFGKIDIDPEFTNGKEGCVTSPSCMGAAFLVGSVMDGPGMHELLGMGSVLLAKLITKKRELFSKGENREYVHRMIRAQGNKPIMLETGKNLILGSRPKEILLPDMVDELIKNMKYFDRIGIMDQTPLSPQVLPVQAMRVGAILIVGIPFEITTIASKRLIQTLLDKVKNQGIEEIILAPYANAYNGYIVTNEEYQLQMYEGGHCVFGQWALNALQEKCSKAVTELLKPAAERQSLREAEPDTYSEDYIQAFTHFQGDFYKGILKRENRKESRRLIAEAKKDRRGASY
jgi:neutral ceramidase